MRHISESEVVQLVIPKQMGSLSKKRRAELNKHLRSCEKCRTSVRKFREVNAMVDAAVRSIR